MGGVANLGRPLLNEDPIGGFQSNSRRPQRSIYHRPFSTAPLFEDRRLKTSHATPMLVSSRTGFEKKVGKLEQSGRIEGRGVGKMSFFAD
jgi:hypothetical protein